MKKRRRYQQIIKMEKTTKSYFYLAFCILLWAFIPIVSKKTLTELDNVQILLYSTIFSVIVLGIILAFQNKLKSLKNYSLKDYSAMGVLGFLGTYLYYILLYRAFSLTTASEGFILAYAWPMFVLIFAFAILKEKITLKKLISILISFAGVIIIITQGRILSIRFTNLTGDILALSGALVFALFSVMGKKYNFDKTISAFMYFLTAFIFLIPTLFIFSSLKLPSTNALFWIVFNGIFVNGITYIFWFKALEHGKTHVISNLLYLVPFISLIYIFIFLGEKILLSSFIGLMVIVIGVAIQSVRNKDIKKSKPKPF